MRFKTLNYTPTYFGRYDLWLPDDGPYDVRNMLEFNLEF
jgi:hypothetical protein